MCNSCEFDCEIMDLVSKSIILLNSITYLEHVGYPYFVEDA